MDAGHGLSKTSVDALKSLFVILAGIAVSLRLIANWRYNRKLLIDDFISVSAIPLLVAVAVLSDLAGNGFHDPSIEPYRVAQLAVAISVSTPLALWTCKAPILFLYLRLFGIKKWLRITSYTTLVLTAAVYASGIVAIPPACTPHSHDLSDEFIMGCQTRTRMINVYLGSVSVTADVVILILPMPVVFGLKLVVKSRVGLIFLFLSGLFAIAASIISLFFKAVSLDRPTTSLAVSILATITECSVALIVGCVPSLRVLWSKVLKPSVKTTPEIYASDPTGLRTNRATSQYISIRDGSDSRKTSDSDTALVVSREIHTTTTTATLAEVQLQQQQGLPQAYLYDGRAYYGGGAYDQGRIPYGEEVIQKPPPFGVYAEAYSLQTRHQGVWGR
ncbi:hypothetical protein F4808DRAFT_257964 [Astrocystis sublimbata]|nr:hypothetical protein F4808DRAFT_465586 [Astrocystis sublimbata]KAI0198601.1 hypothetical protein F4808DRAFT_451963 [Astrocystis sublimbata]KAI0198604.1 hypothetical protein F4808DRAFT_257964 [Astrocystis sublimbata]